MINDRHLVSVRLRPRGFLDGQEDGGEHVCGVVGHLLLQHRGHALKAHARVHVGGWKRLEGPIRLSVELHPPSSCQCEAAGVLLEASMRGGYWLRTLGGTALPHAHGVCMTSAGCVAEAGAGLVINQRQQLADRYTLLWVLKVEGWGI